MDKEQGPTPDDYRDARGPEWRAIFDTLRDYRLSNMTYEGTSDEFYPLVDLMSNEGQGIDTGEMQMVELADEISLAVKTARRSSDEQAEVVGHQWRYRTDPPDAQWRTPSPADLEYVRSLPDKYEVRALFASPPAVAKGGVTDTEKLARECLADFYRSNGDNDMAADVISDDWQKRAGEGERGLIKAISRTLTAALAVGDEGIRPDLLAEMAKHPGWSIERGYRDRGGDEDDPYGWCVHEVRGGRNDREWDLIGFGETPHEALAAAVASLPIPPSRGEGV